jgi:hypothetical protein
MKQPTRGEVSSLKSFDFEIFDIRDTNLYVMIEAEVSMEISLQLPTI